LDKPGDWRKHYVGKGRSVRLGILGGTFDPIHLGHLRVAEEMREELTLEKVYLIPGASPPHKEPGPIASFHHRLAMTRLAAMDGTGLEALDIEGRRPGLSYSIETLREIHRLFTFEVSLFFIIGMDAFQEIRTWKEYKRLFDYANFVVIKRPGVKSDELAPFIDSLGVGFKKDGMGFVAPSGHVLMYREATLMDISSTKIREKVMKGLSVRFLIPESVRSYITEKRLYGIYGDTG
jgi:nicotinate-nucleotide adenylyltransferase